MIKDMIAAALITGLGLLATQAQADGQNDAMGMQQLEIADGWFGRNLSGFVWYPTEDTSPPVRAHGNAVWQPLMVRPDAGPSAGKHPLVVLSHGMFGNARNQAWLAQRLTRKGYIVAAIDHPGTSTFNRRAKHQRMLWERPKDISRVIDHLTQTAELAPLIDAERIYMAGHSLGGMTAIALAGGLFSPEKLEADCAAGRDPLICGIFDDWDVAKTPEDKAALSADLSDPRIKAIAVFDLGGTQTFAPDSLRSIKTPLQIWGAPKDLHGMNIDVESRALNALVPAADYREPAGLAHFDFLGECTDRGLAILKDEEPESVFVCIEGGTLRRAEHDMIAKAIETFFSAH